MKKLTTKQIIDIVLILLLLIFAAQNVAPVKLKFLFFGFDLPLIILIAFTYFIGFYTAKLFKTKKDVIEEAKSKEKQDSVNTNENVN
jgi:uncharacterized integral membrane protein